MRTFAWTAIACLALAPLVIAADPAKIEKASFGKTNEGDAVDVYTLRNSKGMIAKVITYGGLLTELHVPDKSGKTTDVVLGFDNLKGYLEGHPYFGANVGRVGNRIAKGKFTLGGKEYTLATNNGPNHLHGGKKGFDKVMWKATPIESKEGQALQLTYTSPDGEEGYPGNLKTTVVYTVTDKNELKLDISATTDKPTPVNIAHHSYFNLTGGKEDILGHEIMIAADKYTPTDDTLIPTGKIEPVKGTPFDFTKSTPISKHIGEVKGEPGGYDLNYVLRAGEGKGPRLAARVTEPKSGRVMEVLTTEPGVQFYTGNFLDGKLKGKDGVVYKKHWGLCLEAQHFPDSVNHPGFPSVILKPGETYSQTTIYRFPVE